MALPQELKLGDPQLRVAILAGPVLAGPACLLLGSPQLPSVTPLFLVLFLLAYPVLEESAFRGCLQTGLRRFGPMRRQWLGVSVACLSTAVVFSLAHLPLGGLALAALIVLPGLVLGYFRERHDSLLSPILLHAWYNACGLSAALLLARY